MIKQKHHASKTFIVVFSLLLLLTLSLWARSLFDFEKNSGNGKSASVQMLSTPSVRPTDPQQGPENAPVTIVEYTDFFCPHCKDANEVIERVVSEYPEKIRLVFKDLPVTSNHPLAKDAHLSGRCAQAQNKFWEFYDEMFLNQDTLSREIFTAIAQKLRLNLNAFETCLNNKEFEPYIQSTIAEAQRLGIDKTPYLFINGQRLSGSFRYEELKSVVEAELK